MKFNITKIIALVLITVIILASVPFTGALAAGGKKVYVTSNTLKIYESFETSSKVLGTMSFGQVLTCTALNQNWAEVTNGSATGYCKAASLSNINPNKYSETVYAKKEGVEVYARPSTSSKLLGKMPLNTKCTAVAKTNEGNWIRLKHGNSYGYAKQSSLSLEPVVTPMPEKTSVWCTETKAGVYTAPGSEKKVGTMYFGQKFTLLGYTGKYAKVKNSEGTTGYCKKSAISAKNPNGYSQTVYVQVAGKVLYKKPESGATRVSAEKNAKATLVGITENGFWARVKVNGNYYYTPVYFLKTSKAGKNGTEMTVRKAAKIYETASTEGKVIENVKANEAVRMIGGAAGFAKVVTESGETGYVQVKNLHLPFSF